MFRCCSVEMWFLRNRLHLSHSYEKCGNIFTIAKKKKATTMKRKARNGREGRIKLYHIICETAYFPSSIRFDLMGDVRIQNIYATKPKPSLHQCQMCNLRRPFLSTMLCCPDIMKRIRLSTFFKPCATFPDVHIIWFGFKCGNMNAIIFQYIYMWIISDSQDSEEGQYAMRQNACIDWFFDVRKCVRLSGCHIPIILFTFRPIGH